MPGLYRRRRGAVAVDCPFSVVIDTREQRPYGFVGILSDAKYGRLPINVKTQVSTLKVGDYSIVGHEHEILIERKSKADLFASFASQAERDKMDKRFTVMNRGVGIMMIEASLDEICSDPPPHTLVNPRSIIHTYFAWQVRFPRVHWSFWPDRRLAEVATFRFLEHFWDEQHGEK